MIKRRNYLINPAFQLKFSISIAVVVILLSSIYPITFHNTLTDLIDRISVRATASIAEIQEFNNIKNAILNLFVVWQIFFSLGIFIICVFFSHKIAGPIYRVSKNLLEFKEKGKWEDLTLRRGDYFPELADIINQALSDKSSEKSFDKEEMAKTLQDLRPFLPEDKKIFWIKLPGSFSQIILRPWGLFLFFYLFFF